VREFPDGFTSPANLKGVTEVESVIEAESPKMFSKLLECKLPVIANFWAPASDSSLATKLLFQKLSAKYAGRALFVSVNAEEFPDICPEVEFIPAFVVFGNGDVVSQIIGQRPLSELDAATACFVGKRAIKGE
jgi:thioredoxin-like negative regulator of GroEL